MGKIKAAPIISVGQRPRERSPKRADNPKRAVGWTRLDPETPSRANALGIRSSAVSLRARRKADPAIDTTPRPTKRKPDARGGTKRKAEDDINPLVRRPPPKPEGRLKAKKPPKPKTPPPPDVVIEDKGYPKPPPPPPPSSARVGKITSRKSKQ